MSSTTQPTTFVDLYTDLLNRVREETGVTATDTIAKRFINIGLIDMHVGYGEKFPWAEREAVLVTKAEYTTGTVTITQGSTTLTGASTLWNTANDFGDNNTIAGGALVIEGTPEIYRVSSVGSDTSITLTSAYVGDDVSAGTYLYFEDEYALASDFLRPFDLQSFTSNADISIIGRREFRNRFPRSKVTGRPTVSTFVDKPFSGNTAPVRKIKFHKPPDAAYMLPYHYITGNLAVSSAGAAQESLSADADEPIVPLRFRHAILYHALYNYYRDRKDDNRAAQAKNEFVDLMLRITGDIEIGHSRPRFSPRVSGYRRAAERPYRAGRSRHHTTGSSFDDLRE